MAYMVYQQYTAAIRDAYQGKDVTDLADTARQIMTQAVQSGCTIVLPVDAAIASVRFFSATTFSKSLV